MSEQDQKKRLGQLRGRMDEINARLLAELNEFFGVAKEIGSVKQSLGLPYFDPVREHEMLETLLRANRGPMPTDALKKQFKEFFQASVEEMGAQARNKLQVQRLPGAEDAVITVRGQAIGGPGKVVMAGPCAVENREQMLATAEALARHGVRILRGGAFKPRTSPYSFQGLEREGLELLREAADRFDMAVITEVMGERDIELVQNYADILQVGTRNMFNYSLLKALGHANKPVFLKRGMMATIDEFIQAAEYVYLGGNREIILCERGIRTFETQTRNTFDVAAVPILKKETPLPVIVDISHALGRKDILKPIAYAALAAGADGIMVEAHYNPSIALSDCAQQLNPDDMDEFFEFVKALPF